MARSWMLPLLVCLVAAMQWQALADTGAAVAQTNLGLALPSSVENPLPDDEYMLQDAYADEEYIMELERQELEEIQQMMDEQDVDEQKAAEELAALNPTAAPTASLKRLPVPLAPVSSIGQEIRSAVEQAHSIAAQLMKNKGAMKVLGGGAPLVLQEEAAPVNVIELAQAAAGSSASAVSADGIQIDVTVTTERSGPTWGLPTFGLFGGESSSDSPKQAELAAQIAHTVIESALANQAAGADQELVLDMTLENATPESTQQLVAAAAAAAASAAASAALNKQPWDTLELQMEVVETTSRSRYFVIATLLLAVQLLLCFAVATLWAHTEEEDEESQEGEGDALCYKVITDCDLKKHKQQQQQGEWASMAEEGRGLYEKLLSYT